MEFGTRSGNQPHGWGLPMTIGILLTLGGVFALSATALTSVVSVVYFGALLLAVGVLEIIAVSRVRKAGSVLPYVLAGVLTIIVGGLLVSRPVGSLASMTLVIAGYLLASGVFRGITSLADRYPGWGWDLAYAVVTVGLGVYVVAAWPFDSLWVVGTIIAVEIIARGITLVAASWMARDIERGPLAVATISAF